MTVISYWMVIGTRAMGQAFSVLLHLIIQKSQGGRVTVSYGVTVRPLEDWKGPLLVSLDRK